MTQRFTTKALHWKGLLVHNILPNRSLRVVINGQSSLALVINADFFLGSHLGPTLFFFIYIHDLPKNIRRSFVNVYADDTTIYGHTSKILDGQRLTTDLSSELAQTNQ